MTELNEAAPPCMNCGKPVGKTYEGVVVCSSCLSLALMCERRAEEQLRQAMTLLRESLRVALVERRLRGQSIPEQGDAAPPTADELQAALQRMFRPRVDK